MHGESRRTVFLGCPCFGLTADFLFGRLGHYCSQVTEATFECIAAMVRSSNISVHFDSEQSRKQRSFWIGCRNTRATIYSIHVQDVALREKFTADSSSSSGKYGLFSRH